MSNWTVIVPSNRPIEVDKFIASWSVLFVKHKVHLVLMWDLPTIPQEVKEITSCKITQLCHKDLTTKYIPTKTDMIRSFAFKWAYDNTDADYFCTLDDDVRPGIFGDIFEEYEKVFDKGAVLSEYFDVGSLTSSELQMRGFPYQDRKLKEVAVQYGGWEGVLDYDAATQLAVPKEHEFFSDIVLAMPKGVAVTCCIMNTAWRREYTPIMWQLPMLNGRYNRVGDIWSGLLIKKTLDAYGAVMVINGAATVRHQRASDPYKSLVKEAPSVWLNDNLWKAIEYSMEEGHSAEEYYEAYTNLAAKFFLKHDKEYGDHFLKARDEWLSLWT